jgi:hypothetical protein
VPDIVSSTDLPQPKVNKCLIALVGKKAAIKLNAGVSPFSSLFALALPKGCWSKLRCLIWWYRA